jgi:hypothetical protein
VETWKFQTSNEYFDFLDFHDCCVRNVRLTDDSITIEFEFIYVLGDHPLNPYDVAKSTDVCELTFHGVTQSKAVLYVGENVEQPVSEVDLVKMEVLKFDQNKASKGYIFELFGTDWRTHEFCGWKIHANGFSLCWNNFNDDAWYA